MSYSGIYLAKIQVEHFTFGILFGRKNYRLIEDGLMKLDI